MIVVQRGAKASDHLDLLRGLAAVAVFVSHARGLFLLDYANVASPSAFTKAIYFAAGFGHAAVVVFFVLSGYLVGSSALRMLREGRWSWTDYLLSRGTRLWLVLVPALALTAAWDGVGVAYFPDANIYTGAHDDPILQGGVIENRSLGDAIANALFLQTIAAPCFGSNSPLWSLANEFWYYLLFPLLATAFLERGPRRAALLALASTIFWMIGPAIRLYFSIWLMGAGVAALPSPRAALVGWLGRLATAGVLASWLAILALGRRGTLGHGFAADFALAIATAALTWRALADARPSGADWFSRATRSLAAFSYTLYLVHMPVLTFVRATWIGDARWAPTAGAFAFIAAVLLAILVYAWLIAEATEAHTDHVRRWLAPRVRAMTDRRHARARYAALSESMNVGT